MDDIQTARELGQLQERVHTLDSKFSSLNDKIDRLGEKLETLTTLAERGRGAYWAAAMLASALGGVIVWLFSSIKGGA